MAAKTEGLHLNDDGTVDVVFDGTVRHLRRPRLREFRKWAQELRELAQATDAEMALVRDLLADLENASEEEAELIEKQNVEAIQRRLEYTTPWTASVVAELSDKPLPDEPDDWPSWLALDVSIPARIMAHWRTSPLASSGTSKT